MPILKVPVLTTSLSGLASLAAFVRGCLGEVAPMTVALWSRRDDVAEVDGRDESVRLQVVAAAGPFAPTSYARARLLRQLHASGLLSARETEQAEQYFGVAQ